MINERIRELIADKGLQYSAFADIIQVSHSTITHIVNNRNGPSSATIEKILVAFPDVSPLWLRKGEGHMYKHKNISMHHEPGIPFNENIEVEPHDKSLVYKYPLKNADKYSDNSTKTTVFQGINLSQTVSKKITELIIYFDDKSFLKFVPKE